MTFGKETDMPILYHSPASRSDTAARLARMLSPEIEIREVTIRRQDGSGGRDPANPHPEGKVPFLTDGATTVREQGAILLYLTDRYPDAGLGPRPGEPRRGAYLSWLFYYQGVMEPLMLLGWAGLTHPALDASFGDMTGVHDRLRAALADGPFLLGDRFSAADMLCASPFQFFPDICPDIPAIRDWVARVGARVG